MGTSEELSNLYENIKQINKLTGEAYNSSSNFPAINRNCKRILASVKMLMINLEQLEIS